MLGSNKGFVHLHVHSEYSLLDGACKVDELVTNAKTKGQQAIAITDHGTMYAVVDFYKSAKRAGIKPIIGCEVYVAPHSRMSKVHGVDSVNHHLVLLCKNELGYKNLTTLVSLAWMEGFYKKPRVDIELLREYSEGLVAMSACLAGEIPRMLLKGLYVDAMNKALAYDNMFGRGNFYLELQNHGIEAQSTVNSGLARISRETGIPLVATNDCHYLEKEDSFMHEVLLCIQTGTTLDGDKRLEFSTNEFYLKDEREMRELFSMYGEACDNTVKIAEMCNYSFEFGQTKLPCFEVPNGQDHFEYFKQKCVDGMHKIYGYNPDDSIVDRLNYELNMINRTGYTDYYLIVNDFVQYAKSMRIPVGPGRGSGAGSLAAYCIGITGVDPVKYNLLFERFLNPDRVSMPDFDIDFCYVRRHEVIEYVIQKYGVDHVAQIITFGTMAAKGAIRDVGRVMGLPYAFVDEIAKEIPYDLGMTIEKALANSKELGRKYKIDTRVHDLIDMARKLEGMPRHASTHAAGVVITAAPVSDYVPLAKNDDSIVTQYTMTTLDELGLLKMDFLGLRNLTVIDDTVQMIKVKDPAFDIDSIDYTDEPVFKMISTGMTEGVFQFESDGMKSILMQLKPRNIEDLIAVISLYRPGPMSSIPQYIQNRHNPQKIRYKHPLLEGILDVTYGCIVYQEQVMQIFRSLAGYSLGRADIVRRAMSKKKNSVMEREHDIFIHGLVNSDGTVEVDGCIRRGVPEDVAGEIFDDMYSFASYAFNKSHAAAYSLISYQTAWLKNKYPGEYMAALLTGAFDNGTSDRFGVYVKECARLGINMLPPSVNEGDYRFSFNGKDIRMGLSSVKGLGKNTALAILNEREKGTFMSFFDFCSRVSGEDVNRRSLQSLIKSGALDNLKANRRQMLTLSESILDTFAAKKRKNVEGQLSLFSGDNQNIFSQTVLDIDEFSQLELLMMEKETTGIYISGHPLMAYESFIAQRGLMRISDILGAGKEFSSRIRDKDKVRFIAIVSSVKLKSTKSNESMATVSVEDFTGVIDVLVFSQVLNKSSQYLREGNIVEMIGRVSVKEDEEPKIICDEMVLVPDVMRYTASSKRKRPGLYIRVPSIESDLYNKAALLVSIFEGGSVPVYYYIKGDRKLLLAPRRSWVSMNDVLLRELSHQLGKENVVFVERKTVPYGRE